MAIANGTCVSFCNQTKEHYFATSRESRRYVVAFSRFAGAGIWLRQESLRHILASLGYAPGTIAVNFTWMDPVCEIGKYFWGQTILLGPDSTPGARQYFWGQTILLGPDSTPCLLYTSPSPRD